MDESSVSKKTIAVVTLAVFVIGYSVWRAKRPEFVEPPETTRVKQAVVERVISGNRVKTDDDEGVIYAGIRAPYNEEPFGQEATALNRSLVEGKKIRMRFGETQRDEKDRWVAYVFCGDEFVNERLVADGLAYVRLRPGQQRYAEQLLAAQERARAKRVGVWKRSNVAAEKTYAADRKHGLFHRGACDDVASTRPENNVSFASRRDAFNAGFAPCGKCDP